MTRTTIARPMTTHEKKILVALQLLRRRHRLRWWSRQSIGNVVGSSGYHNTVQVTAMKKLRARGLVICERESWPPEVQRLVRCFCGTDAWGLTAAGAKAAADIKVRETPTAFDSVAVANWEKCCDARRRKGWKKNGR